MKLKYLFLALALGFLAILAYSNGWTTSCIVLSIIAIYILFRLISDKNDTQDYEDNFVYFDYESKPRIWAHNDSLYSIRIIRTDNSIITDWDEINTNEGWQISLGIDADPQGSCMEYIEREETRKNGLSFHYDFFWRNRCWWYPTYDIVRMLFDNAYFTKVLNQAEQGDVVSQTLVGCCYGHNGKMGINVVEHSIEKALYWWNKAAEDGFTPAMIELAIYHWHKGEREEAHAWNEKSGRQVFIINYDRTWNQNNASSNSSE